MKRFKNYFLYSFMLLTVVFAACSKSDDDGLDPNDDGPLGGTTAMSAKVDGGEFKAGSVYSLAYIEENSLTVTGLANDGTRQIVLFVEPFNGPGEYIIKEYNNDDIYIGATFANMENQNQGNIWFCPYDETAQGTIKVSSVSGNRIKGSFNFKGKNYSTNTFKNVTDGNFDVEIYTP